MTNNMSEAAGTYYSVIDYTVDGPKTQRQLADAFAAIQLEWVRDYPGYRSSRILASVDGTRLYNVIEWADEEAYAHFERVSDTKGRVQAIRDALEALDGEAEARMDEVPRYRLLHLVTR